MNQRRADIVAGLLVATVGIVGTALSWQAYQQQQSFEQMGSMMDMGTSMGGVHGTSPLWYVLGTLLVSILIGGGYFVMRDDLTSTDPSERSQTVPTGPDHPERTDSEETTHTAEAINPEAQPRARVLDLLPEDERRVLEPVCSSPGITQIELRDRSDFSKSKVSQTVSALEKRGLLYRERQGRTYRIYPSDDLVENKVR